ncbi:flagellar assembly protein FliW [Peribacillus deserti]|uniref:Flagellar assembly factor FliW n=1 Tax=Peribacillus deserti TaxID=673318 RepID=A0A2N5M9N8_9BACI|nr:flagellar assembly protein FliW [Peribacillus deserti]PLT31070.1 flagellar assembly protein FliW [Peribacillus deserti]
MLIQTKYHDQVEIKEQAILQFQDGIPGFLDEKEFVLLSLAEELHVLQSIKTKEVAFIIINPFISFKDYDLTLDENTIEQLKIEKSEQVQVFTIMSVKHPFNKSTINLAAPVVINVTHKKGKQVILQKTDYSIRTPLPELVLGKKG